MGSSRPPWRIPHRLTLLAVLRPGLIAAGLVIAYYAAPMDNEFDLGTVLALAGGLVFLSVLIGWQARVISQAKYPRLRAMEALATSVPLFLVIFATAYYLMDRSTPGSFSEPMTRTDALYLTITMFSTVGFGDITPRSEPARVLAMTQMLGDLLVVGLVARILVGAAQRGLDVQRGLDRRPDDDTADRPTGPANE